MVELPAPPLKILIVKRDKVGDMLLTTPVFEYLRKALPRAEIHVLANDYNAWVLNSNQDIDRVWVLPRIRHDGKLRFTSLWQSLQMRYQLRQEHFDWVLIGNGEESPRAIRLGLSVKGRHTIAYTNTRIPTRGLTHPLSPPTQGNESLRLAKLAEPILGRNVDFLPSAKYVLPEQVPESAENWLKQNGLARGSYIAIGLGTRKATKKPETAQVVRWARYIREQFGLACVLISTPGRADSKLYPGDDDQVAEIMAATSDVIPFKGTMLEAISITWSAATSIMPDGGMLHFAALGIGDVVGLHANRSMAPSVEQWRPTGLHSIYIESSAAVGNIADSEVFDALKRQLERTSVIARA